MSSLSRQLPVATCFSRWVYEGVEVKVLNVHLSTSLASQGEEGEFTLAGKRKYFVCELSNRWDSNL